MAASSPAPYRALAGLLPALREHRLALAGTFTTCLANQTALIALAVGTAWLVGGALTGAGWPELAPVVVAVAALALGRTVATWWEMVLSHDLAYRLLAALRVRVFDGLARSAPARIAGRRSGALAATALTDVEQLEFYYAHGVAQVAAAAVLLLSGTGALAVLHPLLAVVALPFALVIAVVPIRARRADAERARAIREQTGLISAEVVDVVRGTAELAAFGGLPRRRAALAERTRALGVLQRREAAAGAWDAALGDVAVAGGIVAVLLTASGLVQRSALEPRWTPVAVALALGVLLPASVAAVQLRQAASTAAAARRVADAINAPATTTPPVLPRRPAPPYDVVFDDVHFGYTDPVLRGMTLLIAPGETLALVGASGAGKSTTVALLLRLLDPDAGRICLGGTDLREIADADLRRLVGAVPQDVHLLHGTMRDNITLGRPTAPESEVLAAVTAAALDTVVAGLPEGLDTIVGERGFGLSGGERARVGLARALLMDPPVLVLDEVSAALDSVTETAIGDAMHGAGRTTLVVAHRAATVRRADRIALLEDGRIVETGTFTELTGEGRRLTALLGGRGG